MNKGKTISLKEVLYHILLRRRILLIWMIVFAILANGFACFKSYREVVSETQSSSVSDYSQYENQLSTIEIEEVKNAVNNYLNYEKIYLEYKDYLDHSIKMQLDANEVATRNIIYRVDGNQDSVNIADTYAEIIPNDDVCKNVIREMELDIDSSYIRELISVKSSHMYAVTLEGQQFANVLENNASNNEPILVLVEIISDSEDNTNIIGDIIDNSLDSITKDLQKQFGVFNIQKISDSYCTEANKELLQSKQTVLNEINNMSSLMRNLETSLSEEQQPYFSALIEDSVKKLNEKDSFTNDEAVVVNRTIDYIHLKYIIVGAGAGLILFAFYILCRIIFDKHLNSVCYIEQDLKARLLGTVYDVKMTSRIKDKIDWKLDNVLRNRNCKCTIDEQIKLICTNLEVLTKKKNLQKICITCSMLTSEIKELLTKMQENLNESNVSFVVRESFLYKNEELKTLIDADGVVFIEQMEKSMNSEIYKEMEICKEYDIDVLGFVVVEV